MGFDHTQRDEYAQYANHWHQEPIGSNHKTRIQQVTVAVQLNS